MKKAILLLTLIASCSFAQREQKALYTGLRFGGSIGMVFPTGDDYRRFFENEDEGAPKWWDGGSFDVAPFISWQFTPTFALHTEVMATRFGYYGEKYQYGNTTEKYLISRRAALIPVLVKYTDRQFNRSIQFFVGPHFTYNYGSWQWDYYYGRRGNSSGVPQNIPERSSIVKHIKYPPVGVTLGGNFGFITKSAGTVFADVRFWQDLGMIKAGAELDDGSIVWSPILLRGKLSFSLGYEFGFINR